jgi:hypothetical protein
MRLPGPIGAFDIQLPLAGSVSYRTSSQSSCSTLRKCGSALFPAFVVESLPGYEMLQRRSFVCRASDYVTRPTFSKHTCPPSLTVVLVSCGFMLPGCNTSRHSNELHLCAKIGVLMDQRETMICP